RRGAARARRGDRGRRSRPDRRGARRRAVRARESRAPPRRRSRAVCPGREPQVRVAFRRRRAARARSGTNVRRAFARGARGVLAGRQGGGAAGLACGAPVFRFDSSRQQYLARRVPGCTKPAVDWRWAMLRRWRTLAVVLGALAAGTAAADKHRGPKDYVHAKVVDVDPIVRYVTVQRPRRECWSEVIYERGRPATVAGPALAGGLIGGAIGRQFGGGSGR